jgi:hypothetical protein
VARVDGLEVDVEGAMDLNGFFGLQSIPAGLDGVKLAFRVDSDAEPAVLREILEATRSHSPICDTTTRPVTVDTTIEKT